MVGTVWVYNWPRRLVSYRIQRNGARPIIALLALEDK